VSYEIVPRREFLANAWKWGLTLIGAAGVWTSWDLLQSSPASGFGGLVRTVPEEAVPDSEVLAVSAARSYLTRINGDVVALYWKCSHLGCRVPWCETSGQFECPCHGSVFNRAGDYRAGPAPRGMDRFPVEIGEDGLVYIDTSEPILGPAPGGEIIDEPPRGPSCMAGEA
jgi:cytochrome b6-f complex iron-sulfur subunit